MLKVRVCLQTTKPNSSLCSVQTKADSTLKYSLVTTQLYNKLRTSTSEWIRLSHLLKTTIKLIKPIWLTICSTCQRTWLILSTIRSIIFRNNNKREKYKRLVWIKHRQLEEPLMKNCKWIWMILRLTSYKGASTNNDLHAMIGRKRCNRWWCRVSRINSRTSPRVRRVAGSLITKVSISKFSYLFRSL